MCTGTIFNIQQFSIHDGPGIRTTVFLKGCPLRCPWCANPESQLGNIQILYDQKKCIHCQSCVHACPKHAIQYKEGRITIQHDLCTGCLTCLDTCPQHALEKEGETKSIDEIVDVCLKDKVFYEESKGGITISGGEGFSQPNFVAALIKELKSHDLHVAIETTGYVEAHIFQDLAPQFDLLLFDVKHYDSKKHQEITGVANARIVENLRWALKNKIEVLPRIPVIPGFNDSLEDALGFVNLFQKIGIQDVQLLPFHQFGQNKYELLGKDYAYKNQKALYPEDLEDYQQIFIDHDIHCFF